jgi:hypothetical protein
MVAVLAGIVCVLAVQGASAVTAATAACEPTVSEGAGLIGSRAAVFPRRSKFGAGFVLSGRVLQAGSCAPLKGALVEIWQAGKNGYGPAGRASVVVGPAGAFRFEGPRPVGYQGRPGHIHMRISAKGFETVTITHLAGARRSGREVIVLSSLL